MSVTMTQIAREAGVSLSLVSRLLRNDPTLRVTPQTRQRVLEVQKRLGQVQPRRPVIQTCRVVIPVNRRIAGQDISRITDKLFFIHFEKIIKAGGGQVSLAFFDEDSLQRTVGEWMDQPDFCQALLCMGSTAADRRMADLLVERQFPHLCLGVDARRHPVHTLHSDQMGGYLQVVDHLRSLGHERIAFVGMKTWRYPFFTAAMVSEGLSVEPDLFCWMEADAWTPPGFSHLWRDVARESFTRWRTKAPAFTAVCCNNDWVALGVIDAMQKEGLQPGRDISVVGYDNLEVHDPAWKSSAGSPLLTTLDVNPKLFGQRLRQRLLDQMEGPIEPLHEVFPVTLMQRKTSGPARETP